MRIRLERSGDYDLFLQLAVEAAFDWVFYASSNFVRLSVIPTSKSTQYNTKYACVANQLFYTLSYNRHRELVTQWD